MIQIRNKKTAEVPSILTTKGELETEKLKNEYDKGVRDFEFKEEIYNNVEVKQHLIRLQNGKCCFCESKINHISSGDIEHFRPKKGWVQDQGKINKPGYYWLAYEWDNLLFCCEICNRSFKKNHFPISEISKRALNHNGDLSSEVALFVHPVDEDPEQFIEFEQEQIKPVNNNIRGKSTIQKIGLDRAPLNERRLEKLNQLKTLFCILDINLEQKDKAVQMITKRYESSLLDETEYASMIRCFFRNNPINFKRIK